MSALGDVPDGIEKIRVVDQLGSRRPVSRAQ